MTATVPAFYTSVQGGTGSGQAITTDGTVTAGDWLVVAVGSSTNAEVITAPGTGTWAEITVTDNVIASAGGQLRVYKCINPAASTTYTWGLSGGRRTIVALLVRGADPTDCVDAKASLESANGGSSTPPSVTPTTAAELVIDFAMLRSFPANTWTVPASGLSWTKVADARGADGNNNVSIAAGTATAGSSGVAISTTAWTNSQPLEESMVLRIAIKSAAGGPTPVDAVLSATLPGPTAALTAQTSIAASASATLPALSGALTATTEVPATLTATLPAPVAALTAQTAVNAALSATLPAPSASMVATTPGAVSATFAALLPAPVAAVTASTRIDATLSALLPAPVARITIPTGQERDLELQLGTPWLAWTVGEPVTSWQAYVLETAWSAGKIEVR